MRSLHRLGTDRAIRSWVTDRSRFPCLYIRFGRLGVVYRRAWPDNPVVGDVPAHATSIVDRDALRIRLYERAGYRPAPRVQRLDDGH